MYADFYHETHLATAEAARLFIDANVEMTIRCYGANPPRLLFCVYERFSNTPADIADECLNQQRRAIRAQEWRTVQRHKRATAVLRLRVRLETEDAKTRPFVGATAANKFRNDERTCARRKIPEFDLLADMMWRVIRSERAKDFAGVRDNKGELASLMYTNALAGTRMAAVIKEVVAKRWPNLADMLDVAQKRFESGHWTCPVWAGEFLDKYPLHFVHASVETPGNVAFYPDIAKLESDKATSMKPGRYLTTFYADLLSADKIRELSNMQQCAHHGQELLFINNKDPDGWVWVYENSPSSCMRYNRSDRYLASGLYEEYHPVRAYAHPDNDLALAYIMMPGKVADRTKTCGLDDYVVAARTIVNVRDKKYLRVYADDCRYATKLKELLDRAGYMQSSSTTLGQKLVKMYYNGDVICPYLDGHYTNVEDRGDCLVIGDDGVDGQNSCGLLSNAQYWCAWCGSSFNNEDDGCYIGSVDGWVCESCQDIHFVSAEGRFGEMMYPEDSNEIVYCAYNHTYYVEDYLADNDMAYAEDGGIYPQDILRETPCGTYPVDDVVELTYPYDGYDFARVGDVYDLPNGETCHVDDEDKIAEFDQQEAA